MRSHWEDVIYTVVEKDPNIPVFSIKPKSSSKPMKRVHRNNIMACNFLIPEEQPEKVQKRHSRKIISNPEVPEIESSEDEYVVTRFSAGEEMVEGDEEVLGEDNEHEVEEIEGNQMTSDSENTTNSNSADESSEKDSSESEEPIIRRSGRNRSKPTMLTYDVIRMPTIASR